MEWIGSRSCIAVRKTSEAAIDTHELPSIMAMLESLPKLLLSSGGPVDRDVQAGLKPIARRARQIAPDSRKTGTRDKQSKSSKAKWPERLRAQIRMKVIKHENGAWGIAGPRSPQGNVAHFMQEKPRRLVLWGKATMIRKYRIEKNWITQAADETKAEQLSAMETSLKTDIDASMRSL